TPWVSLVTVVPGNGVDVSEEAQTQPFGQAAPPTTQALAQNPEPELPAKQKHAPVVLSSAPPSSATEQAAPIAFVRVPFLVVHKPMSVWQPKPPPSEEQPASG